MIQRIQSLYILLSVLLCAVMFFIPLGYVGEGESIRFTVCGFFGEEKELLRFNWLLSSVLSLTMLIQLYAIFQFKNRIRQSRLVQFTLITLLLSAVLILLIQDLFSITLVGEESVDKISYNYNVFLIIVAWVLSLLAFRAIKKDEALVRSADRMR